jgi:hypothetical protein
VGATVIPGGGFAGSVVRSVLTGLSFLQRLPFKNRITDSLTDGCAWVAGHVEGNPSSAEIEGACRTIEGSLFSL